MITKNGIAITSLSQWEDAAGPKREYQWSPGRSAYEVARVWLSVERPALPREISDLLATSSAFGTVSTWTAEPEARVPFDKLGGEPRNTDVLVSATDQHGAFVLAIEAKADETFGETIADTFAAALERRLTNANSRGIDRIVALAQSLFGEKTKGQTSVGKLRYQLLTATAGALAAARDAKADRAIMLVQEFRTWKTADENHDTNAEDLDAFIHRLSGGAVSACAAGEIVGPFVVPGAPLFEGVPQLYVGKVVHDQRVKTADEAVEVAMHSLGGERSIAEVAQWIEAHLDGTWKDIGTTMADMTYPPNNSTQYPLARQVLERVSHGQYRLRSEMLR